MTRSDMKIRVIKDHFHRQRSSLSSRSSNNINHFIWKVLHNPSNRNIIITNSRHPHTQQKSTRPGCSLLFFKVTFLHLSAIKIKFLIGSGNYSWNGQQQNKTQHECDLKEENRRDETCGHALGHHNHQHYHPLPNI